LTRFVPSSSWTSGAPGSSAATGSVTGGSGSYFTSIACSASDAVSGSTAATAAISSRTLLTFPHLRGGLSFRYPRLLSLTSLAVMTSTTPGMRAASDASIESSLACGWLLLRIFACSMPGISRSSR
jgi:hypothetical protein